MYQSLSALKKTHQKEARAREESQGAHGRHLLAMELGPWDYNELP